MSKYEQDLLLNFDKKIGMFTNIVWKNWVPKVKKICKYKTFSPNLTPSLLSNKLLNSDLPYKVQQ